jgi:hypothetical protein
VVKNSNQQRFGTNKMKVDALHEQYRLPLKKMSLMTTELVHRTTK